MLRIARRGLYWPKMGNDLRDLYKRCDSCRTHQKDKSEKRTEVIPYDLLLLAPAEEVGMDYFSLGKKVYLVIKDRHSGFLHVQETRNMDSNTSFEVLHKFMHMYGYPHRVKTDGGGSFRASFTSLLKGFGIEHVLTSAYRSKSNGDVEAGVKSVKSVLRKANGPVSKKELQELVFMINNHDQEGTGSNAE